MRDVIFQNMLTLDGFFAGPAGELDWREVDDDFHSLALTLLDGADTLLFGRVTYEMMAPFWPSAEAIRDNPVMAARMNGFSKVVFSRTLERADWENTRLVKSDPAAEVARLKQQPGKGMLIFGGADLSSTLIRYGLIDEFRLFFNPIILGQGAPAFKGLAERVPLKLVDSKVFKTGMVLLTYRLA